jgi:GH43 family beta-xylosidase
MNHISLSNPILSNAADPWMYKHLDGYYYTMYTLGNRLDIIKSTAIGDVSLGERKTVWIPPESGLYSRNLWAPELHFINNIWYIYFTANDGGGDESRRIYVLENTSKDPLSDNWNLKESINTKYPGLDGTVFSHEECLYFLYAGYGHFPDYGSAIYISRMLNPWTIEDKNIQLSKPEFDWEKQGGMAINEGPVILKKNNKIILIYSASTTWSDDYCLGMLMVDDTKDLLNPSSWVKSKEPVFKKCLLNGVLAPGHNSFTKSPDDKEDWIIYHAISASNPGVKNRHTCAKKFIWNKDGIPVFGEPVSFDNK